MITKLDNERLANEVLWILAPIAALMALLVLTLCATDQAWSATYNLYFNNSEQGHHSKSKPQINLNPKKGTDVTSENDDEDEEVVDEEDKAVKKQDLEPAPAKPVEKPAPEEDAPGKKISPDENFAAEHYDWNRPHARLMVSFFGASMHSKGQSFDGLDELFPWEMPNDLPYSSSPVGIAFDAGIFANQYFGVNFFSNGIFYGFAGVEGELNPFGIGISKSNLTLGLMIGWTDSGIFLQGPSSGHVGARLGLALSKNIELNFTARSSAPLSSESRLTYFAAQGGLAFRL